MDPTIGSPGAVDQVVQYRLSTAGILLDIRDKQALASSGVRAGPHTGHAKWTRPPRALRAILWGSRPAGHQRQGGGWGDAR